MISDATREWEDRILAEGKRLIAGIDEAGRGPLAGPVVAAAVILPSGFAFPGIRDSKTVPEGRRRELDREIRASALAVGVGVVDNLLIDELNILNATFLAMERAVAALPMKPDHLLIDGNRFRGGETTGRIPFTTVVDGDALSISIAAASIVAKVYRDALMAELDREFPGFGFARHKGYGTAEHLDAIRRLGPSPVHRRSFAPLRDAGLKPHFPPPAMEAEQNGGS
jgi:ribonuclease HII